MSLEREEVDFLNKMRSTCRRNTTLLTTQRNELKELDNIILGYVLKHGDEDAGDKEVKDSREYSGKIMKALLIVNGKLDPKEAKDDVASVKSGSTRSIVEW